MIHVLADQNLHKIEEIIPPQAKLTLYDPAEGIPNPKGFDAMLVRTVTHLNERTFPNIPESLQFIGTGSSGTDHLDQEYLEAHGITLADAKGSNARAVAEYVMTALLLWRAKFAPNEEFGKVGVIGVGEAGSAVVKLMQNFGIECVEYDPPRQERDKSFSSATLEEVLDTDILTFHVPLDLKGVYATHHWLDDEKLKGRSYKLIINAARGGIIDEKALMKSFKAGGIDQYILDVWEKEPDFNTEVASQAYIATPHIAGYSEQAKVNATQIICKKMAAHFGLNENAIDYEIHPKTENLEYTSCDLTTILTELHPIMGYDKALRDLFDQPDKGRLFRNLRNEWPYRYEYPSLRILQTLLDEFSELQKLGVQPVTQ
ncbi:4-phosphoerythronate dehydrogenase [Gracilimonas tropica]|uniref:4-phosphoerythronate dehydrogenase n=1 Tax=Gracilimonas tropica TaxID=454600 RepID=UPI00037BFCCA|nr:4-phosphoerythronate dehydrogenase [Gracilimonas tropica]